jgi:DNA-directed RNA polymerase subunit RPC12/RpoP
LTPSTGKPVYKYAFSLLRNARAFVESAVDYARQENSEQWKFAILHLTTALELLLKARLAIEDHNQLVDGKTQITERQFDEGDFKSVGIDECIKRLGRTCDFSLDNHQRQVITTLRNLRNRVAHYVDPSGDTDALKAATAAGLNLFIEINNAEFGDEDPYGARTILQLVVELHKYDDFVKERLSSLSGRLHSAVRPRTHYTDECSHCLQDAAIIIDDEVQCLFCGHRIAVREYAKLISDDWSVEACRECNRQSVARHQRKDSEPTYECFFCGYFRGPELKWCDKNGAEIARLHEVPR